MLNHSTLLKQEGSRKTQQFCMTLRYLHDHCIHRPKMPSAERERKCTCDHDGDPSSSLLLDRPEAGGEVIKHKHSIFSLGTSHSHNTVTVTVFSLFSAPKAYVYFVYLITSINKIKSAYIHYNNEHITVFTVTVIRKTF